MPGEAQAERGRDIVRKQTLYLAGVARDGTLTTGCKSARIDPRTVYGWRETDPTFVLRERQAKDALSDALEAEATRRATRGVQQPVYQAGRLVGYRTEYSDALLVLLLKANRTDRYREKLELQVPQVIKAIGGVDPTEVL